MGSKAKLAKYLLPQILRNREPGQSYVEPFVGGCNMIEHVDAPRIGADSNKYIISMWKALQDGWMPPQFITEEERLDIKNNKDEYDEHLVGFSGIVCSFGAKWMGTYARDHVKHINYANQGRRMAIKQIKKLRDVKFVCSDYKDLEIPQNSVIYCDPPYANVAGYKDLIDHDHFWQWCRDLTYAGHEVFVSEYNGPDDFKCLYTKKMNLQLSQNKLTTSVEKLFTFIPK